MPPVYSVRLAAVIASLSALDVVRFASAELGWDEERQIHELEQYGRQSIILYTGPKDIAQSKAFSFCMAFQRWASEKISCEVFTPVFTITIHPEKNSHV